MKVSKLLINPYASYNIKRPEIHLLYESKSNSIIRQYTTSFSVNLLLKNYFILLFYKIQKLFYSNGFAYLMVMNKKWVKEVLKSFKLLNDLHFTLS